MHSLYRYITLSEDAAESFCVFLIVMDAAESSWDNTTLEIPIDHIYRALVHCLQGLKFLATEYAIYPTNIKASNIL